MTGERQPIVAEDSDGTGFACDEYYQLYLDDVPLMDKNENYIKTVKQMDDYHPKWNETFEVLVPGYR